MRPSVLLTTNQCIVERVGLSFPFVGNTVRVRVYQHTVYTTQELYVIPRLFNYASENVQMQTYF